jgi:16S rRNA (guanine966-N2)-methyltransferase
VRIVAGLAKGRRLAAPAGATRPTSDRAREALFSSLATMLDLTGARVLDLYAGTGAVALEALSRGAREAVLVESDRAALAVLHRNVAAVGLPGARVVAPDDLGALAAGGWLAEGAVVVVERSLRSAEPRWPAGVTPLRHRRYGDGVLWYGRRQ